MPRIFSCTSISVKCSSVISTNSMREFKEWSYCLMLPRKIVSWLENILLVSSSDIEHYAKEHILIVRLILIIQIYFCFQSVLGSVMSQSWSPLLDLKTRLTSWEQSPSQPRFRWFSSISTRGLLLDSSRTIAHSLVSFFIYKLYWSTLWDQMTQCQPNAVTMPNNFDNYIAVVQPSSVFQYSIVDIFPQMNITTQLTVLSDDIYSKFFSLSVLDSGVPYRSQLLIY